MIAYDRSSKSARGISMQDMVDHESMLDDIDTLHTEVRRNSSSLSNDNTEHVYLQQS